LAHFSGQGNICVDCSRPRRILSSDSRPYGFQRRVPHAIPPPGRAIHLERRVVRVGLLLLRSLLLRSLLLLLAPAVVPLLPAALL
jgi:hypothetical protein